jgi:hypothetical protein
MDPARRVKEDFDLRRTEVSTFLFTKLNRVPKRGDSPPDVFGALIQIEPGKWIEWLIDQHDSLDAAGRFNLARSLGRTDYRETYELLAFLLDDTGSFVDPALPSDMAPHGGLRVCDTAYGVLMVRIGYRSGLLPANLPRGIGLRDPIEKRDSVLRQFKVWWKDAKEGILSKKPSLAEKNPSLGLKLKRLQERQAIGHSAAATQAPSGGTANSAPIAGVRL